jgi:xylulokinase
MERMTEQHLDLDAYDLITLQAASAPPGSNGLMLLPYFMGERSPLWNPHVRGALLGLSFRHQRADLIRAFMEATGYAIHDSIDLIQRQGLTMNAPMGLVEGGAKSRLWRHIIADINGVPTAYIGSSGGAPLGDAVIAGVGTNAFAGYEIVRDWQPEPEIEHPHPAHHRRYQELFRMYRRFRDSLSQDFEALARIVQSFSDEGSE